MPEINTIASKSVKDSVSDGLTSSTQRVFVVEERTDHRWKIVDAQIGPDHITILDAYTLDEHTFDSVNKEVYAIMNPDQHGDTILVPHSRKTICRLLDIPDVPQAQLEQMVALRLEVELPYPPDESTWNYVRQAADAAGNAPVLLVATETAPITLAEDYLATKGIKCNGVEAAQGSLAELAELAELKHTTVAIVTIDDEQALLTISHNGALSYTRHAHLEAIPTDGNGSTGKWFDTLSQDLRQSMMDFTMRTGYPAPEKLIVTGDALSDHTHCQALSERLDISVEVLNRPSLIHNEHPALADDELMKEYSLGLGVLVALYRRHKGDTSVAPALRQKVSSSSLNMKSLTKKLLLVNVALIVALFISFSIVQKVRLNSANNFIEESKPLVAAMDKLREEVDILKYEDGQRRPVLAVLMALSEILPSELKIESINVDRKGKMVITGTTKSVEAVSDNVLEAIKESSLFKDPEFGGATLGKEGFGFTLSCEVSAGMQGAGK